MKRKLQIILIIVSISFKVYSQTNEGIKVKYHSGNCENGTGTLIAPVSDFKFHGDFKSGLLDGVVFVYGYKVFGAYSSDPVCFVCKIKQKTKGVIALNDFDKSFNGLYFTFGMITTGKITDFILKLKTPDIENPIPGINYYNYKGNVHLSSTNSPENGWIYRSSENKYIARYSYSADEKKGSITSIMIGNEQFTVGLDVNYAKDDLRIKIVRIGEFKDFKLHGEGAEYTFNIEDISKVGDFKQGNFENGEYKGAIIDDDF